MKAVRLHQMGRSESLRYEEAPSPVPKDDQVLVRVFAAGITPTEFDWFPTFHAPDGGARPFPVTLGHEFSGIVAAVGPAGTGVHIGDPVYGLNDWFAEGAQAEYCLTVPANIVEPKRAQLIAIARLIERGVLRPILGNVFPIEDFRRAYEAKPLRGKHVMRIAES